MSRSPYFGGASHLGSVATYINLFGYGLSKKKWQLTNNKWVCLKMGHTPNYSHLVGIMISKTIGFFGVHYFQTNPNVSLTNKNVDLMTRISREFMVIIDDNYLEKSK